MKIQRDKCFRNRTWQYLFPCLKGHGNEFPRGINKVKRLAIGIGDNLLDNDKLLKDKRPIFILTDKLYHPREFKLFLDWLSTEDCYITDYPYDNPISGRQHMIVVDVPPEYYRAYDQFKLSNYSNMYTAKQIEYLFKDSKEEAWIISSKVLKKDPEIIPEFISYLKEEFGDDLELEKNDFLEAELDLPIKSKDEIFNYYVPKNLVKEEV